MKEKYGFVYIWYDRKHRRYYIGCHWGTVDDGYICSSRWMRKSYNRRKQDFRRRILKTNLQRKEMYVEEQRYLDMIKPHEIKIRYYNLYTKNGNLWHKYPESVKTVGEKISYSKKGKKSNISQEKLLERGKKISEAKKGILFSEEHKEKLRLAKLGTNRTEDWKKEASKRMKEQWSNGTRKRKEPKIIMNRKEQNKLCSEQLKHRWSNPVWALNQREKLKQAWIKRKENINTKKELV
jgi:hypothetical protein